MDIEVLKPANDNAADFYVYAWLRPNGEPFYIGKGRGNRDRIPKYNNPLFLNIVAKIQNSGGEPVIIRLHEYLTEAEAFAHERAEIARYGRRSNGTGILANLTDGGEGASGSIVGAETRARMSASQKKRFEENPALRELARDAWLGRRHTDETREKMRVAQSGRSPETLAKLSAAMRGRRPTVETRAKMSAAARGRSAETIAKMAAWERTPEMRAKISKANSGRIPTEEQRAKIAMAGRMAPPKEGFKGVSFDKSRGKWFAKIECDGKQRALGRFNDIIQAARAYDVAAIAAWGSGCCYLNFPVASNDNVQMSLPLAA